MLDIVPHRWLEYEPPGLCHTGIETALAIAGTAASVGGTLVSAMGAGKQADYQSALARNQAIIDQQKANEAASVAERKQITDLRKTDLVLSRARALGAASGTDATSPTQVGIEQDIAQQGQYNAMSSLYEGLSAEHTDNYQSKIDLFKADSVDAAKPLAVGGALLSGFSNAALLAGRNSPRAGRNPSLVDMFR